MKKLCKSLLVLVLVFLSLLLFSCKKNYTLDIKGDLTVLEGEQISLQIETNMESYTAKWSSSNPDVASVNNYGIVTGIREGTTTIKVTVDDLSSEAIVTVNKFEINISYEKYLHIGDKTKIIVTHNSELGKEVFYSSTHTSIATVDNEGNVNAVDKGSTVITVTVGGIKKTITITVLEEGETPIEDDPIVNPDDPIDDPEPVYTSLQIDVPTIIKYDDLIFPVANKEVVWKSFNEEILMFGMDDEILLMGTGRVKIRATDVNNQDSYVEKDVFVVMTDIAPNEIEIYTETGSNELEYVKKQGYVASMLQLYIKTKNSSDDSDVTVIWMVDNESIANINDLGVLSANKVGQVTVTAISVLDASVSATITIKIVQP